MPREHEPKRFQVVDVKTGKRVKECFVLLPQEDVAARVALSAYKEATLNDALRRWIDIWLKQIHDRRAEARRKKKKTGPS